MRVKLFKGHAIVEGRKSEYSLYDEKLATYTSDDEFDHTCCCRLYQIIWSSYKSSKYCTKQEGDKVKKLWGGRFTKSAEEWVDEFGASISFDQELVMEDITGSIAHVTMLAKTGILTADEAEQIKKGLEALKEKASNDELEFSVALEDIHLNLGK